MSGKKRITVDEGAWQEAMRKASRLRDVERELPRMVEAVQRAQEEQAARDRTAMQARQDELTRKLASLSDQAARIEASTTRRINAAAATMMNEAREANRQLRADTRQLLDQQEQRFDAAVTAERAERRRETDVLRQETDALREQVKSDREARASVLDAARTAVGDARVLHDAIGSTLPHERFAPGQLARLTDRLAIAEGNVAAGTGETALGHAQELYLRLRELRAEVELRDAEWRAAHLTSVEAVTALAEQISYNSMITVADEESGASAELDVDHWSDGELSAIKAQADELAARLNVQADPPGLAELRDISERSVVELEPPAFRGCRHGADQAVGFTGPGKHGRDRGGRAGVRRGLPLGRQRLRRRRSAGGLLQQAAARRRQRDRRRGGTRRGRQVVRGPGHVLRNR